MTVDSAASAPAAGWYPDPAAPGGLRWWSGAAWTEHTSAPAPAAAPVAALAEDDVPDLSRFARDPGLRPAAEPVEPLPVRRDPYRDRNVLAGLALAVAILSIPGTVVQLLVPVPDLVAYLIGGAPITLSVLGLVASFKLGFPTRMAWLAIAISTATMVAGYAIAAQQAEQRLHVPTVTDVPGITELQQLEGDSGLGG